MIDVAQKYSEELEKLFYNTWYDMRYKFYHNHVYCNKLKLDDDNWKYNDFVSMYGDIIIGHISYSIDRTTDSVTNLGLINFRLDDKALSAIFAKDIIRIFRDIFEKFNLEKIQFRAIMGDNPSLVKYRKLVKKFGGRVVGYFREDTRLMDNKLYDTELYEIFKKDFVNSIEDRKPTQYKVSSNRSK